MTEQHIGLMLLFVGIYFLVCSIWKRDFPLYQLKMRRVASVLGESGAHVFYVLLGIALTVSGMLKTLGFWGAPK